MAAGSSVAVAFIVLLSVVVVFLGLVVGRFWYQNRSLKRRIDYYIGVLDMVKRHVDFAIFSDQTTELQESHRSEGETNSPPSPGGTPGGEGVQAKTLQPSSGEPNESEAPETNASVPAHPPSVPREEGVNSEYSALTWSSQGLQTLRRAADYLELTLQDPSLYSDVSSAGPSPYTPLVWLKRRRSKQKERRDNSKVFGQRIDYRRNPPVSPGGHHMTPSSAVGRWRGGDRPGQDLVGGGGGGGRLPATGKQFRDKDKWQQRQSALISDELLMTNFRRGANVDDKDRYIYQDVCPGASQQQQQPKPNYAAASRGHGGEEELKDIADNAKLKDSLNVQPTSEHHRNQPQPMNSCVSYELTEPRKGSRSEAEDEAAEKSADVDSALQDTGAAAKYVNIDYVERAKRKKAKSSKYTNLPF